MKDPVSKIQWRDEKKTPDILVSPPHACAYVHTEIHITYNMHRHTFAHAELCQNSGTITDVWPSTYQIRNKLFWQCFPLNYSKHHCPKDFLSFFFQKLHESHQRSKFQPSTPAWYATLSWDCVIECWSPPQYSFTSQAPYSEHDHFVFIYSFIF